MFKENDVVVYENYAICKIERIGTVDFMPKQKDYYKLQVINSAGNIIYVNVEKEPLMRYTISSEEALSYLQNMKDTEGIFQTNNKIREKEFAAILKTGDLADCLKVFKGILQEKARRERDGKHLNAADEKSMNQIDKRICGEFAIALSVPVEEVRKAFAEASL